MVYLMKEFLALPKIGSVHVVGIKELGTEVSVVSVAVLR
jgi:hypothetical protein